MTYKTIATPVQDNSSCEIFQRLAFSLGYSWGNNGAVAINKVDILKWLVFNPNTRSIEALDKAKVSKDTIIVSNTVDLLNALKSPVPVTKVLANAAGTITAELMQDGSVKLTTGNRTMTVDREIVVKVADEIGITKKPVAPLAKFEYPETARGGLPKIRYVRLVSLDDSYLKGYEVDSPNSKAVGEFKNFVRNRILDGGTVEIVKFSL